MTRSRCRYGWEHTTREKLDGGRAWSFARQGLSKPRQKILCLGIPGPLQPEKGSADEEILGLGGTESCLLRPISRPGRHLIRRTVLTNPRRSIGLETFTKFVFRLLRTVVLYVIYLVASTADPNKGKSQLKFAY